jgi:hypothetical protein
MNYHIGYKLSYRMLCTVYTLMCLCCVVYAESPSVSDENCFQCHEVQLFKKPAGGEGEVSLTLDKETFKRSVHASIGCAGCHKDAVELPHQPKLAAVSCGDCHTAEKAQYASGVHGAAFLRGDPDVPKCSTCHGKHDVLPPGKPESITYKTNLIRVCLKCHTDQKIEQEHKLPGPELFRSYQNSVHGKAIEKAGLVDSTC